MIDILGDPPFYDASNERRWADLTPEERQEIINEVIRLESRERAAVRLAHRREESTSLGDAFVSYTDY